MSCWNTFYNYSAKTYTFSFSVFSQVLLLDLIDGIICYDLLIFFVAFNKEQSAFSVIITLVTVIFYYELLIPFLRAALFSSVLSIFLLSINFRSSLILSRKTNLKLTAQSTSVSVLGETLRSVFCSNLFAFLRLRLWYFPFNSTCACVWSEEKPKYDFVSHHLV